MDNTVQMHKMVPSPRRWRAITIKHDHWRQRTYVPVAAGVDTSRSGTSLPAFPDLSR